MKRFLLFSGEVFYPHGGWEDFGESFDTIEAARQHVLKYVKHLEELNDLVAIANCWWHIVDSEKQESVIEFMSNAKFDVVQKKYVSYELKERPKK